MEHPETLNHKLGIISYFAAVVITISMACIRNVARTFTFIARQLKPAFGIWWAVFFVIPCHAQYTDTLQYSLRHFNDENGLPQNSVKSIVPGEGGFIWLATENGVVRFDGYNFNIFNKDNTGIESSRIYFIIPSGVPYTYFALTDKEQVAQVQKGHALLIDNNTVKQNIFLQGHLRGIHPVDDFSSIGLPNIFKDGVTFKTYNLPIDTATWFAIDSGRVSMHSNSRVHPLTTLPGANPYNFFVLNRRLYYYSNRRGALLLDSIPSPSPGDTARAAFRKTLVTGDVLQSKAWRIRKRPERMYWNLAAGEVFFYIDQSLYRVQSMSDGTLHTTLLLLHFNMPMNKIASIYYDEAQQQLFMGSSTNGLFVFKRKQFIPVQGRKEGQEVFYAQLPFGDDKVVTPWGRILSPFHPEKKYAEAIRKTMSGPDHYSMTVEPGGNIWVKSGMRLFRFDRSATELTGEWSYTDDINHLYADTSGCVWVGFHVRGLYMVPNGKNDPELFLPAIKDISCMNRKGDDLWLGTGAGLYRISVSRHTVDTIKQFKGKYIRSLYIPRAGEVWITTYDDGFYLYAGSRLTRFPSDRNNYLNTAHCIVEDKHGYFWITTNKGLFQASKRDLIDYAAGTLRDVFYLYYTRENGFNTNEFNGGCTPCAVQLNNGYISLPSLSGLIWFHPDSLRFELPDKELLVDKLEVDQQLVTVKDTVELPRHFQQMKLYVATPYYGNESNLRIEYAFKTHRAEPDWLHVADNKSILLSSLSAGRHQLLIRKCNGFGRDNYTYRTVVFNVPPAYYETWWFRLGLLIVLVLIIWLYTYFRMRYIRHKNKMLEQTIAQHTGELEQTLKALQISEEQLRKQTRIHERLITAMAHDIKSPLKYMTDAAWNMVNKIEGQPGKEEIRKQAQLLFESGTRIYYFTDNLLQYIKLYARQGIITMEAVNLYNVVEEKVRIFSDIAGMQGTTIQNRVEPDIQVHSNGRLLGVIIHNVIDNAVKVTVAGTISITTQSQEQALHIIIHDSGPGMREELVNWCNTETINGAQQNGQRDLPESMGLGLLIVKELLVLVSGRLFVESSPDAGTAVHIIIKHPH